MLGEQRVLLMLVTWGPEPYTQGQARQALDETAAFVRSASFGKTWIAAEVTPWLHVFDTRPGCELERISTAALAAARGRGYDTTRYTTLGIAVPRIDCAWGGAYFAPGIWVNGMLNRHVLAHELGHTYGVTEEGPAWVCDPRCHSVPYLDPFSVMGHGWSDYGAWEKFQFGWLDGIARASRAGAFTLGGIDRPSTQPQGLRVLVAGDEYWFEHRPAPPLWTFDSAEAAPGVVVHAGSNGLGEAGRFPGRNYLIFDPGGRRRPSIQAGETFTVPGAFRVTVTSTGPDVAGLTFRWVDHTRPARPRLLRPLRRGSRLIVRWRRGPERGSGLAAHEISLDGRRLATIQAVRETAGLPIVNDDRVTMRLSPGRRRVAVVAVDRAGNRSLPARAVVRR
jgi:hypothetical protein